MIMPASFTRSLQRHKYWWAALCAILLSFALFGNGISGNFVLDDKIAIIGNPLIDDIEKFGEIFTSPYHFNQPRTGIYRPLTIASYALNWHILGGSPAWFHVVNILLHATAVFLIFVVGSWLKDQLTGILAGLLFLLLPIHVEAVTSIVGRAELFAFLGIMGAFAAVLKRRHALAGIIFFLGLLGKETAIAFLPIWLFWELVWQRASWKIVMRRGLVYFAPALVFYSLLRFVALGKEYFLSNDANIIYNPIKFAPFWHGLWTSFDVLGRYLAKTFVPISFSSDYSFNQIPIIENPFTSGYAILGLIVCMGIIAGIIGRPRSVLGFGAIVFLSSYAVVSNWIFKIGTIMGERLFYTPSFGLVLIVVSGMAYAVRQRWRYGIIALAVGVFLLFGIRTITANTIWRDERRLFEYTYRQSPHSALAIANKAYLDLIDNQLNEADLHIQQALKLAPDHAPVLNLAGQIAKQRGNFGQAEVFWKHAI